jgi:hypothetical protein
MKSDLIVRALKIAAARDSFLIAKANFKTAQQEYYDKCQAVMFEFGGDETRMFVFVRDDYNQVVWRYSAEYSWTHPNTVQIAINEDFIEWQAAYKAKVAAKAKQTRALRKLLTIGIK